MLQPKRPTDPAWQVFRTLNENPAAFASYCPQRLEKESFPLDVAPVAQRAEWVIGAVRMTQHNTPAEARAAGRAIKKIVKALM